jgi:hypothetical protein
VNTSAVQKLQLTAESDQQTQVGEAYRQLALRYHADAGPAQAPGELSGN